MTSFLCISSSLSEPRPILVFFSEGAMSAFHGIFHKMRMDSALRSFSAFSLFNCFLCPSFSRAACFALPGLG